MNRFLNWSNSPFLAAAAWLGLGLFNAAAQAHPGHGSFAPQSWTHYVFEPVHAIPLIILAVAAVMTTLAFYRRRR